MGSRSSRETRASRAAVIGSYCHPVCAGLPGRRCALFCAGLPGRRSTTVCRMAVRFPDGFLWGTATAAHQVEGGNWNNDWWAWEHQPGSGCVEPSGDACDQFHRYPEDIALLARLGFDTYRFSLEWSRIEPERGEWSLAALDHYRRICACCHEHGLVPVVTFHHFTSPRWMVEAGGWADPGAADLFVRYCERAAAHLGDLIGWACTINEPNIVALMGFLAGIFPPGSRDPALRRTVNQVMIDAHGKAAAAIRSGTGDGTGRPHAGDVRLPGGRRRRGHRRAHPQVDGGRLSRSGAGRRLHGRAVLLAACGSAPPAPSARSLGWRRPRWATSSGPRCSRRPSVGRGR